MEKSRNVLVLGGNSGLLGQAIVKEWNKEHIYALDRSNFDIKNISKLEKAIANFNPDLIINTIAHTQVDLAEDEKEESYQINEIGRASGRERGWQSSK